MDQNTLSFWSVHICTGVHTYTYTPIHHTHTQTNEIYKRFIRFNVVYMCLSMCGYVYECAGS